MQNKSYYFTDESLLPNDDQLKFIWHNFLHTSWVDTFQDGIKEKMLNILAASSSRHTADWDDPDVKFLNSVELDCLAYNKLLLNKVRAITINKDHIRIAWMELERFDAKSEIDEERWVFLSENWAGSLFTYDAATSYLWGIWCTLLTPSQWNEIINAIPCENPDLLTHNLIHILNLGINWFRSSSNNSLTMNCYWHYCFLSNLPSELRIRNFQFSNTNLSPFSIKYFRDALSVRWIRQRTFLQ